jgi:hypothetical protein
MFKGGHYSCIFYISIIIIIIIITITITIIGGDGGGGGRGDGGSSSISSISGGCCVSTWIFITFWSAIPL